MARVRELGMNAVAMTDHGNLFGAMSFYSAAREAGVKPILGVEAYVAPGDRRDRTHTGIVDGGYHLVLLAENLAGWRNLLRLCTEAYLTGFYYKPRIDRALLAEANSGLIAISGHLGSELAYPLVEFEKGGDRGHWDRAVESARWYAATFRDEGTGPRFFVELQRHVAEQNAINPHLVRLAGDLGLPLVATNDAHFLRAEDHDAHDTLVCISTARQKDDDNRLRYPRELYVKSPAEMEEAFSGLDEQGRWREALEASAAIASRCNVDLSFESHAPVVKVIGPESARRYAGEADLSAWFDAVCAEYEIQPFDPARDPEPPDRIKSACDGALRALCEAGRIWRYGAGSAADDARRTEIRQRLDRELRIIADKGISAYFLIVWDFVSWARRHGIPALARGSGVGTMVGYTLGLSNACPVRYGLLFERFTDPDRAEYPDIDVDLCQDGRASVLDYVRRKYGHAAQIVTFGTLKARAAIRDVGRVIGLPLGQVDRIARLIPEALGMTLDRAMEQEPDLRLIYEGDAEAQRRVFGPGGPAPDVRRLIDTAKVLEGQSRHASVHAAGVVIANRPLHEIVPLWKQPGNDEIVTQWDGPTCERVGLLKMDFLGLRTLSTIERAKKLIRETLSDEAVRSAIAPDPRPRTQDPLDLDRLSFDDQRVFELFRRADTTGVFQFESGGMRRLLAEMKPDRLEDLIAANALFRPGPMDLIPQYSRRKHGKEAVPEIHPIVDGFTAETYGVMVYQEQVMQIVHALGGIPLRAAYSLIKAISKKKTKEIEKNRAQFIDGAREKGLTTRRAEELFEMILKFAGYGFNKSHSTGYAIVAYQTAWLKTYFPNQYMAAFLTFESKAQKVEDWIRYKEDCRRTVFVNGKVGVEVLPPDINLSDEDFTVVFDDSEPRDALHGHVRFGLSALKGAGERAVAAIVAERRKGGPFRGLFDFCERMPPGAVNKATTEALIACGAMDCLHGRAERAAMTATIDAAAAAGQSAARDRAAGQGGLFGLGGEAAAPSERREPTLSRAAPWPEAETLAREKDVLGFYVSNHPLDAHREALALFGNATSGSLAGTPQDTKVTIGGLVKSVRPLVTRNGKNPGARMAIITFEDVAGSIDAVLFADAYAEFGALLTTDSLAFLVGRVDHSRGDAQIIVERVVPFEQAPSALATGLEVTIADGADEDTGAARAALDQVVGLVKSQRSPGRGATAVPLTIVVRSQGMRLHVQTPAPIVPLSPELLRGLCGLVGQEHVRVLGGRPQDRSKPANGHARRNGAPAPRATVGAI